ncbi:MAG: recombinase [Candidatus Nomurabacteria bacterium GW2011_GWA1_46_11]|uniref:Recombinase n=1 Tax=Candidatus Nomurabacteria bacterium GW2011_GWA1_46_11 TaxID=1618732 RepID=A0A0G1RNM8_9BACT|nr:MAG: recombinase [Candidatus Nomurabacteria bacterium GW2011_GWA1_46_11]
MAAPFYMERTQTLAYYGYCRKSTDDSSEKQVLSLDVQKKELDVIREKNDLKVIKFFTEAKTAKEPGREEFNQMLNSIEQGKANAILCWKLDRLTRNPVDGGRIQWLLQKGVIKEIRTYERTYRSEDHTLITSVEMGMANQYSRDLRTMAFRTIRAKLASGWRPGPAPVGYININAGTHRELAPDPERFDLVKQMWELFLTGNYPVSKICSIAKNKWGFRTRTTRKGGGKPIGMSHLYKMFNDPFYYGHFLYNDPDTRTKELYKGNHKAIISKAEYDRVQVLLGRNGKPTPKTREFPFTGRMKCGECGGSITADTKDQVICTICKYKFSSNNRTACPECDTEISEMKNPTILQYTYYHCTKRKHPDCSQGSIRVEKLEEQFSQRLTALDIDPDYLNLALDYLQKKQETEVQNEKSIRQSLDKKYDDIQTRIANLNQEYTSSQNVHHELYSPDEFKQLKGGLFAQLAQVDQERKDVKKNLDKVLELSVRTFNFCAYAFQSFKTDDIQRKKEIFSSIGSNLILKDGILSIGALEPFLLIEKDLTRLRKRYERLEPTNNGFIKRKEAAFTASIPQWLPARDSNPNTILQRDVSYH